MKCRVDGCSKEDSGFWWLPFCGTHMHEWGKSLERRRFLHFSADGGGYITTGQEVAVTDWLSRVNAERRNSQ